jgi:Xaa-Pro dipeptidase
LGLGPAPALPAAHGASQELENLVKGVQPLGPEDYALRREKVGRLLAEHGLDAVFIGGGTNLLYFTKVGWWLSERVFGVVLSRRKEPIWVCPAFEVKRAEELVPAGQEIRTWEEHENPYATIGGVLRDIGAATGKLGTAPDLRAFEVHGLRRTLTAAEIVDGAPVTEGCRGTKTAKEIAYMDLANRIIKIAFREGFKSLRAGMSTRDLAGAIAAATQKLGSAGGGGPQFGPNTAFPHGSQVPRTLTAGDPVLVDGGCAVEGYHSDVTRTVVFGKPTDKQRRVWDIVRKAQKAALAAAKPGAPCESVDAAARKVIVDAGYGPGYKYLAHRLGHGIGMDGHEYPYLVKGNTLKIEPGMTFSNEPGIYIYGEFGIRTEDCMVVTENGARHLGGMEAVSIDEPFGRA